MKFLVYMLFLFFLVFTAVMVIANLKFTGDFFFLQFFDQTKLSLAFLGFATLGTLTGIFFVLTLQSLFDRSDKNFEKILEARDRDREKKEKQIVIEDE